MAYGRLSDDLLKRLDKMKLVKDLSLVDHYSLLTLAGIAVRAKTGAAMNEHFGSTRDFMDFHDLMFVPSLFPTPDGAPVDLSVTIGRKSARPLRLAALFMLSAYVANFLKATGEEINLAVRCLGKVSIDDVGREDLVALTVEAAQITGLRPSYE